MLYINLQRFMIICQIDTVNIFFQKAIHFIIFSKMNGAYLKATSLFDVLWDFAISKKSKRINIKIKIHDWFAER